MVNEKEILNVAEILNIEYDELNHKPVFTVEEAIKENIPNRINGIECKNLFLKDNKNGYYLFVLQCNKRANMKELSNLLDISKLMFANENELQAILNLKKGSVTPLGIINDYKNKVKILIDESIINENILVHPNVNTSTISINEKDLIKIIKYYKHEYIYVRGDNNE